MVLTFIDNFMLTLVRQRELQLQSKVLSLYYSSIAYSSLLIYLFI